MAATQLTPTVPGPYSTPPAPAHQPRRVSLAVALFVGLVAAGLVGAAVVTLLAEDSTSAPAATSATTTASTAPLPAPLPVPTTLVETTTVAPTVAVSIAPTLPVVPPTMAPGVTPNPIVFPYDWYAVPALNPAEPGAMGSGCDTENMTDGIWHGFITSLGGQTMLFDRACALNQGSYALENKSDRTRPLVVSASFSVYGAQWTQTGCDAFVPSSLVGGEAVWIGIQGGQVTWALRGCPL